MKAWRGIAGTLLALGSIGMAAASAWQAATLPAETGGRMAACVTLAILLGGAALLMLHMGD